jgi:hypothetical protein
MVQHPSADLSVVQAAVKARQMALTSQPSTNPQVEGETKARMDAAFGARKARFEKEVLDPRTATSATFRRMLQRSSTPTSSVGTRGLSLGSQQLRKPIPSQSNNQTMVQLDDMPGPTNVRVLKLAPEAVQLVWDPVPGASGYKLTRNNLSITPQPIQVASYSHREPISPGVTHEFRVIAFYPNGHFGLSAPIKVTIPASPGATPPPPPTKPIIGAFNTYARSGEQLRIDGRGFGSTRGTVHFILPTGQELSADTVTRWDDDIIFLVIPDIATFQRLDAQLYLLRSDGMRTAPRAFHFEPTVEMREIRQVREEQSRFDWPFEPPVYGGRVRRYNYNLFAGFKGNDDLNNLFRLSNGWVVESAEVFLDPVNQNGGAYVWDLYEGTNRAGLNVRWWINPGFPSSLSYSIAVRIVGPIGKPDGIAVPCRPGRFTPDKTTWDPCPSS